MQRLVLFVAFALLPQATAVAQDAGLPDPLGLPDVVRLAGERRDEIAAARALAQAAGARPAIAGALEDPMIAPSLDHLPFGMDGADVSVAIEQRIPLSGLRGSRRSSALAEGDRARANVARTQLDVGLESARAFLMLHERRRTAALLEEQLAFARDVVTAANARYASGTAPQSDVLRAEVEVARLDAAAAALDGEIRGAEAMLNATLGRAADLPVPPLLAPSLEHPAPTWTAIKTALDARPELGAGRADVARATADVDVMRAMGRPMLTIRTGPSYTMTAGNGWMAMVGVSLPIWRDKVKAQIAEAEAMRAMSEADLRAMSRMIEGEAAEASARLQSASNRQAALRRDVLPRARMAIEPAVASYASGQLPLVSVIEAIQALWMVQADLIEADSQLGLAWARLGRALGSYEGIVK